MPISYDQMKLVLEGVLLTSSKPMSAEKLMSIFTEEEQPEMATLQMALAELQTDCGGRALQLKEVASGYIFYVREELGSWITRLWEEKPQKYSRALLETLVIIAYRQPVTRGDIEAIRGVAVSSHTTKTLLEREWIRVVGHRDVPGKPALYATTRQFLDYFGLRSLHELPTLGELKDLESIDLQVPLETQLTTESAAEASTSVETEVEEITSEACE